MWKKAPRSRSYAESASFPFSLFSMTSLPNSATLEISVHDAAQHLPAPGSDSSAPVVQWIDCREEDEHAICHIEGATLIPLSNFATAMEQALPEDKDQPIIVYCHHGMRSLRATNFLRKKGYAQTWSMAGGIDLWSQEIDKDVAQY